MAAELTLRENIQRALVNEGANSYMRGIWLNEATQARLLLALDTLEAMEWVEANAVMANTITGSRHIAWRASLSSIHGECEEDGPTLPAAVQKLRARLEKP